MGKKMYYKSSKLIVIPYFAVSSEKQESHTLTDFLAAGNIVDLDVQAWQNIRLKQKQ